MAELQLEIGGMELNFDEKAKEIKTGDGKILPLDVEFAPDLQNLREQLAQADSKEDILATLQANGINTIRINETLSKNRVVVQETEKGTTIFFDDEPDKKFTFEGKLPEEIKDMLSDDKVMTSGQIENILAQAGIIDREVEVRDDDKGIIREASEHSDNGAIREARIGARNERNTGLDR